VKIAITGGLGFLGWHVACRLRALHGINAVRLDREAFLTGDALRVAVESCDAILHLAGVNRAGTPDAVRDGNLELARRLAVALVDVGQPRRVVYSNSVQSRLSTPYGESKAESAEILQKAVKQVGGSFVNAILPNLFGEHGQPRYNSFVATFCHQLSLGESPHVADDKEVPLLHAQRAADVLIDAALTDVGDRVLAPAGTPATVGGVLGQLQRIRDLYSRGEVPPLDTDFAVDLFNTYRSFTFPTAFPIRPQAHADARGVLVEMARTHGGTGQSFVSTTRAGATRGDHYHLRKIERFFVIKGRAEIRLRKLLHSEVVTFALDESAPGFIDMPTMWVHNITNVGSDELVTVFWADQLLNPIAPDQFPETVEI
jgi:UDP-2-acetamido-2,6-beta-L-arabino-hexul-4-ose reductase